MIFLNSLIFQIPKLQIIYIIFDKSGAFYGLAAILNFSAILNFGARLQNKKKSSDPNYHLYHKMSLLSIYEQKVFLLQTSPYYITVCFRFFSEFFKAVNFKV
jgi:hypothetical protein